MLRLMVFENIFRWVAHENPREILVTAKGQPRHCNTVAKGQPRHCNTVQ